MAGSWGMLTSFQSPDHKRMSFGSRILVPTLRKPVTFQNLVERGQYHLCFTELMWGSTESKAFWFRSKHVLDFALKEGFLFYLFYLFCQGPPSPLTGHIWWKEQQCFYLVYSNMYLAKCHVCNVYTAQLIFCQWIIKWIEDGYFLWKREALCLLYLQRPRQKPVTRMVQLKKFQYSPWFYQGEDVQTRQIIRMPMCWDILEIVNESGENKCSELLERREFLEKPQLCPLCPFPFLQGMIDNVPFLSWGFELQWQDNSRTWSHL